MTQARDREALDQAIVRGSDLVKAGELEPAKRAFLAALEIDPDNPKVLALLGLAYFRGSEFDQARPIYEQLVWLAPADASHRLNLGLVYLKLSDAERAITSLEASRALDPSQGRAVSYLGLAYARAARYPEAYRSFLLAGQSELASEIETNLDPIERDDILQQLGRPPASRPPTQTEPGSGVILTGEPDGSVSVSRTRSEPRTKPPSAPPGNKARESAVPRPEATEAADPVISPRVLAIPPLQAPRPLTVSQRFILPRRAGATEANALRPFDGHSMVSSAVDAAEPTPTTAIRTASGGLAARPLSELATEGLVRPDDGSDTFEIGTNGSLLVRVADRVFTRLDGVHATGGSLSYERAMRRSRGHQTDQPFDDGRSAVHAVTGTGYLIAVPVGAHAFAAIALDDDILYLREDLVFAFQSSLRWENGNVPGLRGKLNMVQFRGDGTLALRLPHPLVRVKLPLDSVVSLAVERIAGWIGRVIPRAIAAASGGPFAATGTCIECTGEGVVLVEAPREPTARIVAATPVRSVDKRSEEPRSGNPTGFVDGAGGGAPRGIEPPETPIAQLAPEFADLAADLAAHADEPRDET